MFAQPLVIGALGAAAIVSILLAFWLPLVEAERSLARRLRSFVQAPFGQVEMPPGVPARTDTRDLRAGTRPSPFIRFLDHILAEAESSLTPGAFLFLSALAGAVGFTLALLLLRELFLAVAAGMLASLGPLSWLRRRRAATLGRFKKQLPETIGLLASSVRSGHSLPQALEHVAADAPEPTKSAFQLVGREIGLGASQEDALERLAARFPSDDLQLVVAAINVQHQIGGSLAKVLDSISDTIRERIRIEGDIKALTAPQRMSAYVLSGLPIFVTVGLLLIGPDYIGVLFQPGALRYALFAAITLVLLGFLTMRAMTKIDV